MKKEKISNACNCNDTHGEICEHNRNASLHGHTHSHAHEHHMHEQTDCHNNECDTEHEHKHSCEACNHEEETNHTHGGCCCHHEHEEGGLKKDIVKVILSAVLLLAISLLHLNSTLQLLLCLVPYLICGYETIIGAFKGIINKELLDERFLMTIATIGAFAIGECQEAVFVMMFYQVGEIFEHLAVKRSRESITALIDVKPEFANLEKDGKVVKVEPSEIKVGDILVIKPGERVPVDGVIVSGETNMDMMVLTGESEPRACSEGDEVYSGGISTDGLLRIQATKSIDESTSSKILSLVEDAQDKKAKTESFITRFARVYTPIVVTLAFLVVLIPTVMGYEFTTWLERGLLFLVVSCPCALVVSVPLAYFAGIGGASRHGILVKGANYLEILNEMDTIAFDKTGTLTEGKFEITKVNSDILTEDDLIKLAAHIEINSNHPIALSIKEEYKRRFNKPIIDRCEIKDIAGRGVRAVIEGKTYYAGTLKLMQEINVECPDVKDTGTIVYISLDKKYIGYIVAADRIKKATPKALKRLKSMGMNKLIMLTGDRKEIADSIAAKLEIDEVYSECLPQEKMLHFEQLCDERSGKVAYVGDGINDAPVLVRADVGIAMGAMGQDAAIEAADVVLMEDNISKIAAAIKIAKKTKSIVLTNIIFAIGIKVIVMILGAIGIANMWEAVFADVGVTVIAVLNSIRAFRYKEK